MEAGKQTIFFLALLYQWENGTVSFCESGTEHEYDVKD